MTYELRIMLNSEDSGFDPNNQPESASGSAAVNEYVEMRAYMYKVENGQDLERTNVTASSTWSVCDNVTGESVSGVTITDAGTSPDQYKRLRATSVMDVDVRVDYPFNQNGYGHLYDNIPVSWTTGGGQSNWTEQNIGFSVTRVSGTAMNGSYKVVATSAVPCNVTVTVTYNTSNTMTFDVTSGSTESSQKSIRGSNVRVTGTSPSTYDDSVNRIHYYFNY